MRAGRGFTLVETMVALAVALIVIGVTMVMILGSFNNFGRTGDSAAYDQAGDGVYGVVRDGILDAQAVLLSQAALDSDDLLALLPPADPAAVISCFYLYNGRLFYDGDISADPPGADLMGESFYLQTQLSLTIEAEVGNPYVAFTVELLSDSGGAVYRKTSGFSLLNTTPLLWGVEPSYIYFITN